MAKETMGKSLKKYHPEGRTKEKGVANVKNAKLDQCRMFLSLKLRNSRKKGQGIKKEYIVKTSFMCLS
jgi:hypothetical protein